jgi:hypothetical protein
MSPPRRLPHRHQARFGLGWALLFSLLVWGLVALAIIRLLL